MYIITSNHTCVQTEISTNQSLDHKGQMNGESNDNTMRQPVAWATQGKRKRKEQIDRDTHAYPANDETMYKQIHASATSGIVVHPVLNEDLVRRVPAESSIRS